jgi:hypothetical protein
VPPETKLDLYRRHPTTEPVCVWVITYKDAVMPVHGPYGVDAGCTVGDWDIVIDATTGEYLSREGQGRPRPAPDREILGGEHPDGKHQMDMAAGSKNPRPERFAHRSIKTTISVRALNSGQSEQRFRFQFTHHPLSLRAFVQRSDQEQLFESRQLSSESRSCSLSSCSARLIRALASGRSSSSVVSR